MKYSTPKLTIPSFTFRLEVIVGIILLYLMISCLVFGSCLKVSFGSLVREGNDTLPPGEGKREGV